MKAIDAELHAAIKGSQGSSAFRKITDWLQANLDSELALLLNTLEGEHFRVRQGRAQLLAELLKVFRDER